MARAAADASERVSGRVLGPVAAPAKKMPSREEVKGLAIRLFGRKKYEEEEQDEASDDDVEDEDTDDEDGGDDAEENGYDE